MTILVLFIMLLLLSVTWQDFRHRAVYWYLFPLLGILFCCNAIALGSWSVQAVAINLILLTVQFGMLHLYYWLKHRHWLMKGQRYIGWGDVCFMTVLTVCLSPLNFALFMLLSLVAVLLVVSLVQLLGFRIREIPLAGGQALLLLLLWGMDYQHHGASLYSDHYVEQLLLGIV